MRRLVLTLAAVLFGVGLFFASAHSQEDMESVDNSPVREAATVRGALFSR